jgi:hypothetical protein
MTDEYESTNCCRLNSESSLSGCLADTYGYAAVKDILEYERDHAKSIVLHMQIEETREKWRQVFVNEMQELLQDKQP